MAEKKTLNPEAGWETAPDAGWESAPEAGWEAAPEAPTVPEERGVLSGIQHGINTFIPISAARAAEKAGAGYETALSAMFPGVVGGYKLGKKLGFIKDTEHLSEIEPNTTGGKVASFLTGMADPVAWMGGELIGGAVKLRSLTAAEGMLQATKSYSMMGQLTTDLVKKRALDYAQAFTRNAMLRGAIEGGFFSGTANTLDQLQDDDPFSASELVLHTGIGSGLGLLTGGLFGRWGGSKAATKFENEIAASQAKMGQALRISNAESAYNAEFNQAVRAASDDSLVLQSGRQLLAPQEQASRAVEVSGLQKELGTLQQQLAQAGQEDTKQILSSRIAQVETALAKHADEIQNGRVLDGAELDGVYNRLKSSESAIARLKAKGSPLERFVKGGLDPVDPKSIDSLADDVMARFDSRIEALRKGGRQESADYFQHLRDKHLANFYAKAMNPTRLVRDANGEARLLPIEKKDVLGWIHNTLTQSAKWADYDRQVEDSRAFEVITRLGERESHRHTIYNQLSLSGQRIVKALRKISPKIADNFGLYMQHVQTDPLTGTQFWNPSPEGAATLARDPGQAVKEILFEARRWYDVAHGITKDAEYRSGYVNHVVDSMRTRGTQKVGDRILNSTLLHEQVGPLDPTKHVLEMERLMAHHANKVSEYEAFKSLVPEVKRELFKMLARGNEDEARDFIKVAAESMGTHIRGDLKTFLADDAVGALNPVIRSFSQSVDPRKAPAFVGFMQRQMYAGKVALNPFNHIQNRLQPEVLGWGEIGPKNVTKGRLFRDLDADRAWEAIKDQTVSPDIRTSIIDPEMGRPTSGALKHLDNITEVITKKARGWYQGGEAANRRAIFRGAYMQARDAAANGGKEGLSALLGDLNSSQRKWVLRTFDEANSRSGIEAAIKESASLYGQLRDYRVNFMMAYANKPEMFRSWLGRAIPFTTWSANNWSQLFESYREGGSTGLAERAAKMTAPALLLAYGASRAFGLDFLNTAAQLAPTAAPLRLLTGTPMPGITEPLSQLRNGPVAAIGSAFGQTAPGSVLQSISKAKKANDEGDSQDALKAFLGLKPQTDRDLPERANEELVKLKTLVGLEE